MRNLFGKALAQLKEGKDIILSTVIASSGSVPRGAGARMLTTDEGRLDGTVGGGAVEYACIVKSKDILKEKRSFAHPFYLRKNDKEDLGMICGGDVEIYFSYLGADEKNIALLQRIEAFYEANETSWIILDITEGEGKDIILYGRESGFIGAEIDEAIKTQLSNRPKKIVVGSKTYYTEKLVNSERVFIFGGGHVSQSLVPVLAKLKFRCVILEDREEFCNKELFEGVEETLLIDNERVHDFIDIHEEDYICIMTRGHKADTIVQAQALRSPAHYIGVIGSRRKIAGVRSKLKEMGFTEEELDRVITPIGLEIKAETPDEIAISIAGQLIMDRAGRE